MGDVKKYDVVIVGGGIAGQPMARLLADAGFAVALVDRAPPQAALQATADGRVFAISGASQKILAAAQAWQLIEPYAQPILDIRVAEGEGPFFLHFDHQELGDAPFGYMVESQHLRRALWRNVEAVTDIDHLAPVTIERIEFGPGLVRVELADRRVLTAPLVIAADGKDSRLRQQARIPTHQWSYRQTGIVCAMAHELPHDGIAVEHFRETGPFASLPIKNDDSGQFRSGVVWCLPPEQAKIWLEADVETFSQALQQQTGGWLGQVQLSGKRFAFPLSLSHAETYVAPRLALIGDAAHAMHPIAGQGYNLGLRDVAQLAEILVDGARLGLDLGDPQLLQRYDRARRVDAISMMAMTDGLTRLFSNDIPPVKLARGLGLSLVNKIAPVRKIFMKGAVSGGGSLLGGSPRLARGEKL